MKQFFLISVYIVVLSQPVVAKKIVGLQTDKMFFTGLQLALSDRNGVYYLSDNKNFKIFPSKMFSGGVEIGKRFPIGSGFRLELPAVLNIGSTWEDVPGSIALVDGTSQVLILKKMYITIGLNPQLQYVLPLDNRRMNCYLSAVGGYIILSILKMSESKINPV